MNKIEELKDWLQDGSLLYRLTGGKRPENIDEINVTMAGGSRSMDDRIRRATDLLALINRVQPAPAPASQPAQDQERNFCARCGKRLGGDIHTCTPPATRKWVSLTNNHVNDLVMDHLGPRALTGGKMSVFEAFCEGVRAAESKLRELNGGGV